MLEENAFRTYVMIGSVIIFGIFTGLTIHYYDVLIDFFYEIIGKRYIKY